MISYKKILVYLHEDADPTAAVALAVQYAREHRSQLTLIDVIDDDSWALTNALIPGWKFRETLLTSRQRHLESIQTNLQREGLPVSTKLLIGRPSIEIVRLVLRGQVDLLITTAKPDPREDGLLYRSITLRLLRLCPCPVWIVHPKSSKSRRILAAVDCSRDVHDLGFRILDLAYRVSQWRRAQLHVVYAWENHIIPLFQDEFTHEHLSAFQRDTRTQAQRSLLTLVERLPTPIPPGQLHLIQGGPKRVIPRVIQENAIDLVVMGTVKRKGFANLNLSSTADRILHRLPCSMLAIKPEGFVSQITFDDSPESEQLGG